MLENFLNQGDNKAPKTDSYQRKEIGLIEAPNENSECAWELLKETRGR